MQAPEPLVIGRSDASMPDLPTTHEVRNLQRSLAMTPAQGLSHDTSRRVLAWLVEALEELRKENRPTADLPTER
jgi:hypothetical protein